MKPELPPLSIFMRGGGPNAHIETDSLETANALVTCANENDGAITYEMLVDFYNKIRLENGNPRKRVIGFDLSSADFTNWPLRDTGALHEKRKQIVADVTAELKAEKQPPFFQCKTQRIELLERQRRFYRRSASAKAFG